MAKTRNVRGVERREEENAKRFLRDTKPFHQQIASQINNRPAILILISMLALIALVFPVVGPLLLLIGSVITLARFLAVNDSHLLFRLPAYVGDKADYNSPKPGRSGYAKAEGVFLFGNDMKENGLSELWLSVKDILTHVLIFGTTGSGKTETLVSMAVNFLCMGSGYSYTDPKGAPKLAAQHYILCRMFGRDDDFRLQNFSTSGKPRHKTPKLMSNNINPFAFGGPESLSNMLTSLMPKSEGGNEIFAKNGQNLINSLMYGLCELRDKGELILSVKTIRDYMEPRKYDELARRSDLSKSTQAALKAFLGSVGWDEKKPFDKQSRSFPEQYGYARAYLSQPLTTLTDTYGHIYLVERGEIDMVDLVLNRRILVTIIPYLEKSTMEVESLGQITLSAQRNAISVGLGTEIEGTMEDILESLPTESRAPFGAIIDEYAAIPTPGFEAMLTQGRGLGVSTIVASQDYPGIKRADEKGAQQIVANTNLKVFMKQEDGDDTLTLLQSLVGEASVVQTTGYGLDPKGQGNMGLSYQDEQRAALDKRSRIDFWDLKQQIMGEFHAVFEDNLVRGATFFANPPLSSDSEIRINRMLPMVVPDQRDVDMRIGPLSEVKEKLLEHFETGEPLEAQSAPSAIKPMLKVLRQSERVFGGVMERAIVGLLAWDEGVDSVVEAEREKMEAKRAAIREQAMSDGMSKEEAEEAAKEQVEGEAEKRAQESMTESEGVGDIAVSKASGSAPDEGMGQGDIVLPPGMEGMTDEGDSTLSGQVDEQDEEEDLAEADKRPAYKKHIEQAAANYRDEITDESFKEDMTRLETEFGRDEDEAKVVVEKQSKVIEEGLRYPPEPPPEPPSRERGEQLKPDMLGALNSIIEQAKQSIATEEGDQSSGDSAVDSQVEVRDKATTQPSESAQVREQGKPKGVLSDDPSRPERKEGESQGQSAIDRIAAQAGADLEKGTSKEDDKD